MSRLLEYDVDGITAACLLTGLSAQPGLDCALYIPDRLRGGLRPQLRAIETLKKPRGDA
jgi:single-stranded DNA-specific DHH superfamily exonuclease